jgi:colanic acid/amylovoran biosynthesis glycosyltransferase
MAFMKIAFIVSEFPSLSQTFVLNQVTGLLDLGHDIEIFALKPGDLRKVHDDVIGYGLLKRTTFLPRVPVGRWELALKGLREAIWHFPGHPGVILRALDLRKFRKLRTSFKVILRCIAFLGRGSFDVVHCHFGPCGNVGLQCHLTGAVRGKMVTAFHGFDLTSYVRKNGKGVYDALFAFGDLCMPISHHWQKKLVEMGCSREKVIVHHMGVDTKQFQFRKDNGPKRDRTRVLSVARLVEKKGIRYGIEAVSKIVEQHGGIEYAIVGDGPLKSELEQLARDLKMDKEVRFLGWMNQEGVTELMAQSDILLAPSVTAEDGDQEGIPVVLMEALAMGLPVVSTEHSAIPELIVDRKTGLLAPERDSQALADRIIELMTKDSLVTELKKNGREFVEENFDIGKLNSDLERIFHGLLKT